MKKQEPKKDAFADFGAFSTPTLEFEATPRKDEDDFGDFGDFEDAPTAQDHSLQPDLQADNTFGDFGDFEEAKPMPF